MAFNAAANEIVSNSICTAVCIDNDFDEPYSDAYNVENSSFKIPKNLYESFKEHNCILDFHKYQDLESWLPKKNIILKNKDLLILDWQLTDGALPFKDALEILFDAVKTDSLPFIYLYTDRPELDEIVLHIYSYLSGNSFDNLKENYDSLCDQFEEFIDGEDANELISGMKNHFIECIQKPENIKEIKREIVAHLKKELGIEPRDAGIKYNELIKIGTSVFNCSVEEFFKNLGLFLNNGLFRKEPVLDIEIRPIEGEKHTYLINNTLVKISTKKTNVGGTGPEIVSAEQVYSDFSKTISKRPNNFLALLGLEMRNLYRERCSIIGKDINEINELAFFHHQESLEPEEDGAFHEFLSNIWKDEVSSFLLEQKPRLFSVLNDYKIKNEIDSKLEEFHKNPEDVIQNLAKLNYYYTILRITHVEPRKIRFGDIFHLKNANNSNIDFSFLLCITPHCDCFRPEKINNYFYFVGGKEIKLSRGLKIGDSGFISYVKTDKGLVCIEWEINPFTIYISENNIINPIEFDLMGQKITLKHLTWQKENHTQRIANESFSHASRVGIDLAKIEDTS